MAGITFKPNLKWDGTNGGKMALWKAQAAVAKAVIAEYQLQPITVRTEVAGPAVAARSAAAPWIKKIGFPGIPVPHLHYGGKIYPVTYAQWKQFSGGVIRDVQGRLARAGQVGLPELEALTGITAKVR